MTSDRAKFINRELSWLAFNQRVLDEALNADVPLLERLGFLAITACNLDEFFMVRVGSLEWLIGEGATKPDPSGLTPAKQLQAVSERVGKMVADQYIFYRDLLEPALAAAGIRRVRRENLSDEQGRHVEQVFNDLIFPVVTPMAVGGGIDFPLLTNLGLHVAVRLGPAENQTRPRFAILPLQASVDRFVALPSDAGYAYMLVEDMVMMFVDRFFPGEPVAESIPFRLTRNADFDMREDLATDFLAQMEAAVSRRKHAGCVRLELDEVASQTLTGFLQKELGLRDGGIYRVSGPLDLADFRGLTSIEGFEPLKFDAWPPQPSPDVDLKKNVFDELTKKNLLLFHPYDSFEPVLRLIKEASIDPDVLAVKQTLYRTSRNSPVVAALKDAALAGKNVTVIVELKARFDEEQNIEWARELEEAGAQVIYGVKGLKTHAKLCIVVRREPGGIARYLHFGTGNYNERTARIYSDVSYMTRDPDLGADATAFFNAVAGYSQPHSFLKLEAAPIGLRRKLMELIENETGRKEQGQKAIIMAKVNSLADTDLIQALYRASQAGVTIRLSVRGICCLRPGVKGLSENISVVGVVDRFLEHSRICYFYQGGDEKVFISSADWMSRNLDRRIELLVPVDDLSCRNRLISILKTGCEDGAKGWRLLPDGTYESARGDRKKALRSQEYFFREARGKVEEAEKVKRTIFEPHLPPTAGGATGSGLS